MKHLLFILTLISLITAVEAHHREQLAVKGWLDLRNTDLSQATHLNGEWEFYWNQLQVPPGATPTSYAVLPKIWNKTDVDGQQLDGIGYATYRLNVVLPQTDYKLRVSMPEVYTAYELFVNGELMAKNGVVADNPNDFQPRWLNNSFELPFPIDTAEFVLVIANFVHHKGGIKDPILIGNAQQLELDRRRVEAVDLFLTGCLFMGGLFFFGLYLLGNRDNAVLLFSLFSMIYCYRIMGVENYALHTLFPTASWSLLAHLEYLTLFISVGLFALYTEHLYPEEASNWATRLIYGICALFSLVTLFCPPYYFSQLINPFLVVTIFCILYALYVYFQAYRSKRMGSRYAMMSTIALMFLFGLSILNYWGIWPTAISLMLWAYISFFFLQSLVLSQRVSFTLRKAKKQAELGLQEKSDFLSTMSHEIRTPLNSVIGMSHLLRTSDPRTDQIERLDTLMFSAKSLLTIVNDILDYSKLEAGRVIFDQTEMDVGLIARNIVAGLQNFAHENNTVVHLHLDPKLQHQVMGDQTRFFQVLNNLVHNAVKFTPGGTVDVSLTALEENEDTIILRVEVKDTGIGISPQNQKIIFNRFTQADSSLSRKFGGTGLGLAISQKILALQGVNLEVESEEGKGSIFSFVQPFEKSQTESDGKNQLSALQPDETALSDRRILLVEDNRMNVMVARSFLQNWGVTVTVAENGREALEVVDKQDFDLILMDLHMPVMDGYEAAKIIRSRGSRVPIIALTANSREEVELTIDKRHFNNIIVKPFLPEELYQKIIMHT